MVVDIVVYSLILPSSMFGVFHEEKVVQIFATIRAVNSSRTRRTHRYREPTGTHEKQTLKTLKQIAWNDAQAYGMGASGAAVLQATPQWIHHGCLVRPPCL
jgi:hypothetical protein